MENPPIWDEKTYQFLFACAKKLTVGNPELQQEIPDILSRVYLKSCKRQDELMSHPNPMGWLVQTLKWMISEEARRLNTEKKYLPYSMDVDANMQKIESILAHQSESDNQKQQYTDDQMTRLQDVLTPEELHFLLSYYAPHSDRKALAREAGLSYDGLRQRAYRLVDKIRRFLV